MKRFVLATFGSLGDLHPYVAVALELKARRHEAVIATSVRYREKIEALGIEFTEVRPDLSHVVDDPVLMRRVMDERTGTEVVVRELTMPHLRETYDDLAAACVGADVLVGHPLTYCARLVSEKTGIAWASSVLAPIGLFSATDPPVVPNARWLAHLRFLGPAFHRAVFALGRRSVRAWSAPWRKLRADLGLPPTDDEPLFEGQHSPTLVLALFSSTFAPPQADWPTNTVVTGFPFFDDDGAEDVAPDLARFLDAGPPPLVFTLGSSAVRDAGRFFEFGAEAARRLGRRAVLLVGRDVAPPASLPEGVAAFDYAPYSTLFPRAAAVVHQGGVGTTAQALRAGRPMLVVPYAHDQFDNAARVARLGVARTMCRRALCADRLTAELGALFDDSTLAARAADVGRVVAAEDGARAAADALLRL